MALPSSQAAEIRFAKAQKGFSLAEVVIVIAVIAILAAISIPTVSNMVNSSKETTATANLDYINRAVLKYNNSVSELTTAATTGIADEQTVFSNLQTRDAVSRPGSPYLEDNYKIVSTSSATTYRAFWNGRAFELLPLGSNGMGLDLLKLQ